MKHDACDMMQVQKKWIVTTAGIIFIERPHRKPLSGYSLMFRSFDLTSTEKFGTGIGNILF